MTEIESLFRELRTLLGANFSTDEWNEFEGAFRKELEETSWKAKGRTRITSIDAKVLILIFQAVYIKLKGSLSPYERRRFLTPEQRNDIRARLDKVFGRQIGDAIYFFRNEGIWELTLKNSDERNSHITRVFSWFRHLDADLFDVRELLKDKRLRRLLGSELMKEIERALGILESSRGQIRFEDFPGTHGKLFLQSLNDSWKSVFGALSEKVGQ